MGNRSKAEWMSCFARSLSLNGFQGWVRLWMCYLVVCVWERERVCVLYACTCKLMCVCVVSPCSCVPASFPLCLSFHQTAWCTLEFLPRLAIFRAISTEAPKRISNLKGVVSFPFLVWVFLLSQQSYQMWIFWRFFTSHSHPVWSTFFSIILLFNQGKYRIYIFIPYMLLHEIITWTICQNRLMYCSSA